MEEEFLIIGKANTIKIALDLPTVHVKKYIGKDVFTEEI